MTPWAGDGVSGSSCGQVSACPRRLVTTWVGAHGAWWPVEGSLLGVVTPWVGDHMSQCPHGLVGHMTPWVSGCTRGRLTPQLAP